MAVLINTLLEQRSFELIRDRIYAILVDEIQNQYVLSGNNPIFDVNIFLERNKNIDYTEMPAIVVSLATGDFGQLNTNNTQDGTYKFNIDIYGEAPESDDVDVLKRGDAVANVNLQRLSGVVQAILSSPQYLTLAFPNPFIGHREVSGVQFGTSQTETAAAAVIGRIIMEVRSSETVPENVYDNIATYQTQAFIGDTDYGYLWGVTSADPIPPVCAGVNFDIVDSSGSSLYSGSIDSGGDLNQEIQDSTAVLKNTNGAIQSTTPIKAQGYEEIIAEDAEVTNSNSTFSLSIASGEAGDLADVINIQSDGTPTPTPAQTPFICTPVVQCEPQYELVDFFTLDQNNPFGNTNRRTDTLGGQVYANNIVIDWYTRKNGKILCYENVFSSYGIDKASAQIYVDGVSHGGFTGWILPEWDDSIHALYPLGTRMLNYAPFNLADNSRFWTNTNTLGGTQSFLFSISQGVGISAIYDTWPNGRAMAFRWFTIAELGF